MREAGVPDLIEVLAERLAPTDLHSLLLAVARKRAASLAPADVLRRYREDRNGRPSDVPLRRLRELERAAIDELPEGFELLDLSPVCPFGTSAVLGAVAQDRVMTTVRGSEVVSDPTTVLALECALRRRNERTRTTRLATCMRILRTTPVQPPFLPHFTLFALVSAGRAGEESHLLAEHLGVYERLLRRLGLDFDVDLEPRKAAYYSGATFGIAVGDVELVEGGFVDWTARLLGDRKERLLTSGAGLDLLAGTAWR